jgi:hypothetical protein
VDALQLYEIFKIIVFTFLVILLVVLAVVCIRSLILDRKVRKIVLHELNEIVKKGYSWAVIPKESTALHDAENNPYVSAKKVSVQLVGTFPSGTSVYKTESGNTFSLPSKALANFPFVVDVAGNVYYYNNGAAMVDRRLVLTNDDNVALLNNFHIINDPQEANDYLAFRECLFLYFSEIDTGSTQIAKIDNSLLQNKNSSILID